MEDGPVNLRPLEYAPVDAALRRRRIARRAMAAVVGIGLIVLAHTAWKQAPRVAGNIAAWSEQRAWIARPPTPDVLIFHDTRPTDMGHFPEAAVAYDARSGTDRTLSATAPRAPGPDAITLDAFRGRARSDDGVDCFVTVRISKFPGDALGNRTLIDAFAHTLATPLRPPLLLGSAYEFASERDGGDVQVFRPRPDPTDPSHLTMRTRLNGDDAWFDLWITDAGKTVKIERRRDHPQLDPDGAPGSRIP